MATASIKDYLHLNFLVFIWGFTAILGLLITIPAVEVVFYRTLIAVVALLPILAIMKKNVMALERKVIIKITLTGVVIAAHWILFFAAARVSNASVCLAGMATCALWTSFLEPIAFKKRIKGYEVALGLVIIAGLYIIFKFEFSHKLGLFMAVGSAMLAAVFSVINGKLARNYDPYIITFYEMLGAFLGTALFLPIYAIYFADGGQIQLIPTISDWGYLIILSLICTVYAFSASVELLKRISVFATNLTINMEPVYGIILALLIFGEKEKMGGGFYLGASVIVGAILSYPLLNKYFKRKALETSNVR